MWDVFLSYSRADLGRVEPLVAALEAAGLRVFVDHAAIPGFGPISSTIRREMARSKVLLAYYSAGYPHRPACQWELTTAYLAGWHEGDPRRRVLIVNPERGSGHIHPIELRDSRHWPLPSSPAQFRAFAAEVEAYVAALSDSLPLLSASGATTWSPGPRPLPAASFTGRTAELWHIHSALNSHAAPLVADRTAPVAAQLRGPAGIGKTLLAQEYALRFAGAFPAGVYWFSLDGRRGATGQDRGDGSAGAVLGLFADQLRAVAEELGLRMDSGAQLSALSGAVGEALGRLREPFLWVVDGLPGDLDSRQVNGLCAPHPGGRTLITTRTLRYSALAAPLEVLPLPRDASYSLLTTRHEPEGSAEQHAAGQLAHDLGGHPLALDLLGSAAQHHSFGDLLAAFHTPASSVLDTAASDHSTPTDWPLQVTAALTCDALLAGPPALDVLRIGSALSPDEFDSALVADAIASAEPGSVAIAMRRTKAGIALLRTLHLVEPVPAYGPHVLYRVPAVTAHSLQRHDPDPARAQALRLGAIRALRGDRAATLDRVSAPRPRATGPRRELQMPDQHRAAHSDLERMAAFDLQTELVLRIGIQQLEPGTGSLREALASLHSLFAFTRSTLRQYNIGLAAPSRSEETPSVHALADELLNQTLRPFLSRWHPALTAHEAARPEGVPPLRHEQDWEQAQGLRDALTGLSAPMGAVVTRLAAISGADLGTPALKQG